MKRTLLFGLGGFAVLALMAVGVNVGQLDKLQPGEAFEVVAEGLKSISDPAARSVASMYIFGKAGRGVFPLMVAGAA
jgi:hypothetical protein